MIAAHGAVHPVLIAQAIAAAETEAVRISRHRHAVPGAGQALVALKAEVAVVQAAADAGNQKRFGVISHSLLLAGWLLTLPIENRGGGRVPSPL